MNGPARPGVTSGLPRRQFLPRLDAASLLSLFFILVATAALPPHARLALIASEVIFAASSAVRFRRQNLGITYTRSASAAARERWAASGAAVPAAGPSAGMAPSSRKRAAARALRRKNLAAPPKHQHSLQHAQQQQQSGKRFPLGSSTVLGPRRLIFAWARRCAGQASLQAGSSNAAVAMESGSAATHIVGGGCDECGDNTDAAVPGPATKGSCPQPPPGPSLTQLQQQQQQQWRRQGFRLGSLGRHGQSESTWQHAAQQQQQAGTGLDIFPPSCDAVDLALPPAHQQQRTSLYGNAPLLEIDADLDLDVVARVEQLVSKLLDPREGHLELLQGGHLVSQWFSGLAGPHQLALHHVQQLLDYLLMPPTTGATTAGTASSTSRSAAAFSTGTTADITPAATASCNPPPIAAEKAACQGPAPSGSWTTKRASSAPHSSSSSSADTVAGPAALSGQAVASCYTARQHQDQCCECGGDSSDSPVGAQLPLAYNVHGPCATGPSAAGDAAACGDTARVLPPLAAEPTSRGHLDITALACRLMEVMELPGSQPCSAECAGCGGVRGQRVVSGSAAVQGLPAAVAAGAAQSVAAAAAAAEGKEVEHGPDMHGALSSMAQAATTARTAASASSPSSSSSASPSSSPSPSPSPVRLLSCVSDPLVASYRPLLFYLLTEAVAGASHLALRGMGFRVAGVTRGGTATVYVWEPPPSTASAFSFSDASDASVPSATSACGPVRGGAGGQGEDATPLVFLHGIGLGLTPYLRLLGRLVAAGGGRRRVFAVQYKHVSMRLTANIPTPHQVAADVADFLEQRGVSRMSLLAHSYGTLVASALTKLAATSRAAPAVSRLTLVDPVCFAMFLPHLVRNAIYQQPLDGNTANTSTDNTGAHYGSASADGGGGHRHHQGPTEAVVAGLRSSPASGFPTAMAPEGLKDDTTGDGASSAAGLDAARQSAPPPPDGGPLQRRSRPWFGSYRAGARFALAPWAPGPRGGAARTVAEDCSFRPGHMTGAESGALGPSRGIAVPPAFPSGFSSELSGSFGAGGDEEGDAPRAGPMLAMRRRLVRTLLRGLVVAEFHCSVALRRRLDWARVNLWPSELPPGCTVVLSGRDNLVPVREVATILANRAALLGPAAAHLHPTVLLHPHLGHGGFLAHPDVQDQVLAAALGAKDVSEVRQALQAAAATASRARGREDHHGGPGSSGGGAGRGGSTGGCRRGGTWFATGTNMGPVRSATREAAVTDPVEHRWFPLRRFPPGLRPRKPVAPVPVERGAGGGHVHGQDDGSPNSSSSEGKEDHPGVDAGRPDGDSTGGEGGGEGCFQYGTGLTDPQQLPPRRPTRTAMLPRPQLLLLLPLHLLRLLVLLPLTAVWRSAPSGVLLGRLLGLQRFQRSADAGGSAAEIAAVEAAEAAEAMAEAAAASLDAQGIATSWGCSCMGNEWGHAEGGDESIGSEQERGHRHCTACADDALERPRDDCSNAAVLGMREDRGNAGAGAAAMAVSGKRDLRGATATAPPRPAVQLPQQMLPGTPQWPSPSPARWVPGAIGGRVRHPGSRSGSVSASGGGVGAGIGAWWP